MTEIEIVPCLSDNYAYLVKDRRGLRRGRSVGAGAGEARPWRGGAGSSAISSTPIIISTIPAATWP